MGLISTVEGRHTARVHRKQQKWQMGPIKLSGRGLLLSVKQLPVCHVRSFLSGRHPSTGKCPPSLCCSGTFSAPAFVLYVRQRGVVMLTLGFREIPQLLERGQERKSNNRAATLAHSLKRTAEGRRCLQVTSVAACFHPLVLAGGSEPPTSCSLPGEQNLCVRKSPAAHLNSVSEIELCNHLLCCWLVFPCSSPPKT